MDDDSPLEHDPAQRLPKSDFDHCYAHFSMGVKSFLRAKLPNDADVNDCLNRVFEKLWTHGQRVPAAARGPWLFAVAKQEAALFWRKLQRQEAIHQRLAEDSAVYQGQRETTDESYLQQLLNQELQQQVLQALKSLPFDQRQVIGLRIQDQQTFRQIAEQLDIPLGTAISRFHQAIAKIRTELAIEP